MYFFIIASKPVDAQNIDQIAGFQFLCEFFILRPFKILALLLVYACRQTNKATGHQCPNPGQYNCKDIDDQVAKLVIWQLNRTEVLDEMAKQAYKEFDVTELSNRISNYRSQIEALEKKKTRFQRTINDLDPSSPTYDDKFDFYDKSLGEVISDIIVLKNMIKEDEEKIKNAKEREAQWNDSLQYMLRLFSNTILFLIMKRNS